MRRWPVSGGGAWIVQYLKIYKNCILRLVNCMVSLPSELNTTVNYVKELART